MDFSNAALFGRDPQAGIVAIEFDGESEVQVFIREESGFTRVERHSFRPFRWVSAGTADATPLAGGHTLASLLEYDDWTAFQAGARNAGPTFSLSDPIQQFLTRSGKTLFKEMTFESLRRLAIHIEVHRDPLSPHIDPDRDPLRTIALRDSSGWEIQLEADNEEMERGALERLSEIIAERDPDVIEGHSLFKVILPHLAARARRYRMRLRWGRDGSPLTTRSSRLQIAEKAIQYTRFSARGRHCVDTWVLAQLYDVGTRELEGFSREEVGAHFGIEGDETSPLSCARQVQSLSAALSTSYFIQAQIFPYNYQDVILRGNATKIDALFLREYLHRAHSIPEPPEVRTFEGGYTDIFFTGVASDVWHCDVTSLYPSVMLRFGLLPANDTLGIFGGLLSVLRTFRIEAKRRMRDAATDPERKHLSALQNTFKILINSFYGYLGFGQGHFADFATAAAVTAKGRELLRTMVDWLGSRGARVIEIDTDGIYFQPPPDSSAADLESGLRSVLPDGIDVELDARYSAMLSYKAKNYALLAADGRLTLTGAALKSRGMEPFLREYLLRAIGHILRGDGLAVENLRAEFEQAIRSRAWPIERLAKTESLQDSLASYSKKIAASSRNRSAAFELALASGRDYQAGDRVTYYITGIKKKVVAYEMARMASAWNPDAPDENVEYYVAKLNELHLKFASFASHPPGEPLLL